MTKYKEYGWTAKKALDYDYIYPQIKRCIKGGVILDIGCGNGTIANALISEGFDVYGIDASSQGIEVANQTSEPKKRFFICDIDEGKIPSEIMNIKFDTIISTEVIEHMYSPEQYINFCKSVFKNNGNKGKIIISTPYHGYLKNLAIAFVGKWDAHFTACWEGGHIKFWSKKTLSSLLEKNGFCVKEFLGCGRIPFFWKSMIIVAEL